MAIPPHILTMIRDRLSAGDVEISAHVIEHAWAEGFRIRDAFAAVRTGIIIEHYADRRRCLVCAHITAASGRALWLHVVRDYNDPIVVGIVTAYVPDMAEWQDPPLRRR